MNASFAENLFLALLALMLACAVFAVGAYTANALERRFPAPEGLASRKESPK